MDKRKPLMGRIFATLVVALFAFLCVMPFAWMISTSFKYEIDVMNVPFKFIEDRVNVRNYSIVWNESNFPRYYLNSLKVTFLSLLGNLCFTTLAAYGFARLRFRGKEIIFSLYLATMMIPDQVILLPKYLYFSSLGLTNNHLSLILPAMFNVFGVFLMRGYFETIPFDITEAAVVDGAGQFRIFAQVIAPLTRPGLMTLLLLSFTWSWNDYLNPLIYLSRDQLLTITVGLARFQESASTNYALIMAGAAISLFPILVLFVFTQKYFIESFAMTGIKG
jgi:multiple sugar transport system permease protein